MVKVTRYTNARLSDAAWLMSNWSTDGTTVGGIPCPCHSLLLWAISFNESLLLASPLLCLQCMHWCDVFCLCAIGLNWLCWDEESKRCDQVISSERKGLRTWNFVNKDPINDNRHYLQAQSHSLKVTWCVWQNEKTERCKVLADK